ncbi:hypothetical protein DOZ52_26680 [Enterobacter hormaechei]|uniref:hypothetical protein n=1 Tax=Enterobacter hormaechei TaxID=158836 RepID=UPI000DBFBA1F|nr:hypothetical protein [Enterobacter hormaechei]RAM39883.1 hypothetical protein DOZ52_26680 [Enterobacter hormaechei]
MTECLSIPCVKTTPKPFGVNVEWKWPDSSFWGSQLELQYLLADDRLVKEVISWPVTGLLISGRKAGERLQVRLRPVRADGSAREWRVGDWIDATTSTDVQDIVDHILEGINESQAFKRLVGQNLPPSGGYVTPQNYTIRVGNDENGRLCATGFGVAVENGKKRVELHAEKFEVNMSGTVYLKDAVISAAKMKTRLSDDMRDAVIDAVRESDLFKALQASQDAQASALVTTQQAIEQAATDAIRNALKPGGLLYRC